MLALYIIGGILLFFAFILSLKATVTVAYRDEVALSVRVLFLNFRIRPQKKKKGPHAMSERKAKKIKEKLRKKQQTKADAKQKKQDKRAAKKEAPAATPKKKLSDILDIITLVRALLAKITKTFFGHLRIDVVRLKIRVATGDAASTAIAYGAVTQAVNLLFPLLDGTKTVSTPKKRDIDIVADFLGEEMEADIKISFSLRVWHVLHVGLAALLATIKHFIKKALRDQKKSLSAPTGHKLPPKS